MVNIVAEALMLAHRDALAKTDELKKRQQKEYQEALQAAFAFRTKAQETCTHPEKKESQDFDYHKREEWTEVHCTVCGKRLERY